MNTKVILIFLLGTVLAGASGAADFSSVGVGHGVVLPHPSDTNPCPGGLYYLNADGSYENGYAWQYGGVLPPYYGAFAEGYDSFGACGIQLMLSTLPGYYNGQTLDAYVWDAAGGNPNNILSITPDVSISPPAIWPNISVHDIDVIDGYGFQEAAFVGFWGDWVGVLAGWFVAVDLDGFGGLPRTNIAPGIGYPTGWQDPSIVWGPTQALGIGVYSFGIGPVPVQETTWGRIKESF